TDRADADAGAHVGSRRSADDCVIQRWPVSGQHSVRVNQTLRGYISNGLALVLSLQGTFYFVNNRPA
ncbi:MAG: hypothetical protein ABI040_07540, partial [Rhodoferax sp.]